VKWAEQTLIALDLETTGVDPATARIWEIGAADRHGVTRQILVNPEVEIPAEVATMCGLTPADLESIYWDKPLFRAVSDDLCRMIAGRIVVGYNILSYDWPLLEAEFRRQGRSIEGDCRYIIDVLVWVRYLHPRLPSHKLAEVATHFGVDGGTAHRAVADCMMTLGILARLAPSIPEDLDELLELQATLKEEQDHDYASYAHWLAKDRTPEGRGRLFLACGKYRGTYLTDADPGFLRWAMNKVSDLPAAVIQAFRERVEGR